MNEAQQLRLTVRTARPQDGVTVLALAGECDLYEAHCVETALEAVQMSDGLVLVDVSELRFVDSAVLHVLLEAQRSYDTVGCRLVLVAPSREFRRTLATAGFEARFEIRERLEFEVHAGDSTPPRETRPASIQSLFRSVNERIFEMSSGWHPDEDVRFFCECLDATCTRPVTMSTTEYERMRSSSTGWVAISPAHSAEERSRVVEAGDCYLPMAVRSGGDG